MMHHDPNDGPLEELDRMEAKARLQFAESDAPYFRTIYRLEARIERQQVIMCWMIGASWAAGAGMMYGLLAGVMGR